MLVPNRTKYRKIMKAVSAVWRVRATMSLMENGVLYPWNLTGYLVGRLRQLVRP